MSRKNASFARLYDYMHRDDGSFVSWNLRHPLNRGQVLEQFHRNAELLRKNARCNVFYHEIVSLQYRRDVPLDRQMKALHDLTNKYLSMRGTRLIGYGRMHLEQGHLHMHLMLSANELNQEKRHWLTKADFREIQQQCERYLHQNYPDLKQPVIYLDGKEKISTRQREYEYTRRTGKPSRKQQVRDRLAAVLAMEYSGSLAAYLEAYGFDLYQRGKHVGVIYQGTKYRIKTLGLQQELEQARSVVPKPEPTTNQKESTDLGKQIRKLEKYYRSIDHDLENPNHTFEP